MGEGWQRRRHQDHVQRVCGRAVHHDALHIHQRRRRLLLRLLGELVAHEELLQRLLPVEAVEDAD